MYSSKGFSDWEIGDIDVVVAGGVFHLFHLIIPNHDYIAHAVSRDGISWKRVKNALYAGEPGDWDDDMLWTMNVAGGPGRWRMLYTGLSRKDSGRIQRLGAAVSDDLYRWEKIASKPFPLSPEGPHYEAADCNPRTWVSFRDPFLFKDGETEYVAFCGRTRQGAVFRRGCAGVLRLGERSAEFLPPLHWPRVYDDVECPCVFSLGGLWFLVGSIREDVQVRYWYAERPLGPYQAPSENVLCPKGNYAARIAFDGETPLLYSFFILGTDVSGKRVLPPPKRLVFSGEGRLHLASFDRWDRMARSRITLPDAGPPVRVLENPRSEWKEAGAGSFRAASPSGYEFFLWEAPGPNLRWKMRLEVERIGKLGLIVNANREGEGYFIVIDVLSGSAQIRSWGSNGRDVFKDYVFENLQTGHFRADGPLDLELIAYGNYLELSVSGKVVLSLMNYDRTGSHFGLFSSSAILKVSRFELETLEEPDEEYAGGT